MLIWLMFLLYIVLSAYILWRVIHWLKVVVPFFKHKRMQAVIIVLYLCFASTLILGGLLPASGFKVFMHKLGNYWLGVFIYILFDLLIADIVVLIMKLIDKKFHKIKLLRDVKGYYMIGVIVIVASFVFSFGGFVHAQHMYTSSYEVDVDKKASVDSLKIALVADWHLGYNVGCKQMQNMVDKINDMNADIVVIAGDEFDNDYDALDDPEQLISILQGIKSKYGVYAVYGNHDIQETLIGGFSVASKHEAYRDPRMDEFMKKANINVMTDDIMTIAGESIYLVGRIDGEKSGDGTSDRATIQNLTEYLDKSKPIIVINHEPNNLKGVSDCGVDIMLSGHTHAGQFFPLTITQPLAWDNYWGELKVGNMYSFVTSGVGLYGPNMRMFTNSEVMEITVNFK